MGGKIPTTNKLLAILNLIFGGAGLTIGLIGTFGYASIPEYSKIIPTVIPLCIISILYIIASFVSIGAGFSFVKEEHSAVKKSKQASVLFLILFVLNTFFSIFALYNFNIIGEYDTGSNKLPSMNLITSDIESSIISRKLSDIRFDEYRDTLEPLNSTRDIVRWMITPMRIKKSSFEEEILDKINDDNLKKTITSFYDYDDLDRVFLLKSSVTNEDEDKIIIPTLIKIGYLRDYRIDNVSVGSTIQETPTLFSMKDIEKDKWHVVYALMSNKDNLNAKYYASLIEYKLKEKKSLEPGTEHYYEVILDKGETIYVKLDSLSRIGLRGNPIFWKLRANQDINLEMDDKEMVDSDFSGYMTTEPTIIGIERINDKLKINIGWKTDEERSSQLDVYYDFKDEDKPLILKEPQQAFLHKMEFDIKRDSAYRLDVSYDKNLPFSLLAYILISVLGFLYPIINLILIRASSVKEWLQQEEKVSERPENLSKIAGINIFLVPLQIWLAFSWCFSGFLPSPNWSFTLMGIIGILIVLNSFIGLASGYALMSYSKRSKILLKTFTYVIIIALLIAMFINLFSTSYVPKTYWDAIELLYQGSYPSINYIPREVNMNAIITFTWIVFFTFLLEIYPLLFMRKKLKGENIKIYLNSLNS